MPLIKKKISELPLADSLKGLYTIGYKIIDGIKTSVKVSLEDIQTAYQDVVNAIKKSEEATSNANNAAVIAEEKAAAANTAAQDAEKIANNPTYIGKDHYVYVYNKDTESFDKTDIYCKGEPGSSFRVAGEYATLEALKSAVPDGSAVDGFMAVGTEAPYDYYAWVSSVGGNNPGPSPDGKYLLLSDGTPLLLANEEPILLADNGERVASNGEWVSQGKIGGIEEAPTDGKAYGRKNGNWAEVPEKKYVDDSISSARSVGYMMQLTEIDASGLDENTWYPVIIQVGNNTARIEVATTLWQSGVPSWTTHDYGFSVRKIWEVNGFRWGASLSVNRQIFVSEYKWADTDPIRGIGQMENSSNEYVFVRGGGKYQFYTSHGIVPELKTERFEADEQSIEPTTETPAGIVANIATKEYVDNISYGKVIDVADGSLLTINKNIWDTEAYDYIVKMFGSTNVIKNTVIDICNNHTKYYIHSYSSPKNCIELSSVYCYYTDTERYEIQFNISYYTTSEPVSKRIAIALDLSDDIDKSDDRLFIEDILVSDNLQRVVKRTKSEYDSIGTKNEYTMYATTDA